MIFRRAAVCVLLALSTFASGQVLRWQVRPESLPNWDQIEHLSQELVATNPETRARAEAALFALGTPALHPLLVLGARDLPQSTAVQRLWPRFGAAFISEVIDLQISEASPIPCQVAARIGKGLHPTLLELAARDDHVSRRFALCVLRHMRSDGVPTLVQIARDAQLDASKREAAINELIQLRDDRAAAVFLEGLADRNPGIVQASAWGLAKLKDPRVLPKLIEMANDREATGAYRGLALAGLGAMYSTEVRGVVARNAWQDDDVLVRKAASNALVGRGDQVADRIGRRYFPSRYSLLFPYYTWGPRVGAAAFLVCLAAWLTARREKAFGIAFGCAIGGYWGFFVEDVCPRPARTRVLRGSCKAPSPLAVLRAGGLRRRAGERRLRSPRT